MNNSSAGGSDSRVSPPQHQQQWIDIQLNTFSNWINEQMQSNVIKNLSDDLADGVLLIRLVETLQGRRYFGKVYDENPTEIQRLMNVQMALDALREDGVKTVNIGSHDIVEGNTKLILGLIWCLVQRYQIASRTKIPPKKLVMAWIQSVLPELKLVNFRTSWNDGKALSALLEYCQPGLCPEWSRLDSRNARENCARALELAEQYLGVPQILSADHLSSIHLDELSCITYLSYFIKREGPGYRATLQRAQLMLPECDVQDFDISWSDGYLFALLIEAVGGQVPDFARMSFESFRDCVDNITSCLESALQLGVASLVGADDLADPQGEHLGTMALVAAVLAVGPQQSLSVTQCFTNQQVNLDLAFAEGSEVRVDELDVQVLGPTGIILSNQSLRLRKSRTVHGAVLSLVPSDPGFHQVRIYCQGAELPSSPISLRVLSTEDSRSPSRVTTRATSSISYKAQSESQHSQSSTVHESSHNQPSSSHFPVQQAVVGVESRLGPNSSVKNADRKPSSIERSLSEASDIDISHKSFAQRRLHIIKQLEAQNHPLRDQRSPTTQTNQQQHNRSYSTKIPVTLEASAHHEMPLTDPKETSKPSDIGLVSFSGLTEPCSVGSIVEVVINAHGDTASTGSVYVDAVAPSGRVINCDVHRRQNSFMATFTPTEIGLWRIGILYEGDHIRGSPFTCQVFDPNLVNVYGLDVGLVGQELRFTADASQAGSGQLTVSVFRHGREIESFVEEQGNSRIYRINFVPDGAGQYKIHVIFNRMEAKGSPFILDIADASSVSVYGENLRMASVGNEASFMIHAVGADCRDIGVFITGPSGRVHNARILQVDDVTFKVIWIPKDPGEHTIDIRLFDQSVYDSPYICNVGAPDLVDVRAMPRRIQAKDLYTDHSFEIDASSAGSGNLEIMINGGRVPCRVKEIGTRQYMAIFTPTQSVTHSIEMRFNGEEIPGSPWRIPVEERAERRPDMARTISYYSELSGPGLVRAPVGHSAYFDITGEGLEEVDIQTKIFGPDGKEYPIKLVQKGSGKFTAEYQIEQVGEHQLTVWIAGRKVDGSPLSVAGYSSQKVRIEPLGGGAVGQPVQFVVDAVEAGKGQLEISVNQGRVPNNVQMQGAGRCLVTFIPQKAGTYVIDVTFNGEQVQGCPIRVEILPKQVGQTVQANLTPTAVSTAVSADGSKSISSQLRENTTGTSPTSASILSHARQRSEEKRSTEGPKSANIMKDIRGRSEQPWKSSFGPTSPTSSRLSSSLSPQREWAGSAIYDKIYGNTARTLSPSDPSRTRIISETTTTTTTIRRTPSPSLVGVRSREFAERQLRTPSPSLAQDRNTTSPFTIKTSSERDYRSPSPARDREGSRTDLRSPVRETPSPSVGERVKRIERIDPIGDEEDRERRRQIPVDVEKNQSTVGYTVAQYGEPGVRHFGDTLEKKTTPVVPHAATVFERTEKVKEQVLRREPSPPRSEPPKDIDVGRYRSPSPPPDYDNRPSSTTYKKYEPQYFETTTTTTSMTSPHRTWQQENTERHYEEVPATTTEGLKSKEDMAYRAHSSSHMPIQSILKRDDPASQGFLRTQSELINAKENEQAPPLHRADEHELIYDMPPADDEDDRLKTDHHDEGKKSLPNLGRRPIHDQSVEIDEPLDEDINDPIEVAESQTHVQSLEPVNELPHSPAPSAPTTPATTPKVSAKFKKEGKEVKPFDFGKSKFTSKHEVIKRGKDVEVKLENLKLGKEDVLRVVVMAPIRPHEGITEPQEVETKVKKSGSKYEVSFKPADVGTHKIFAYVNEVPHPSSPYAIRVYDASQIIVGEIPTQSRLNDTVEFTVDAGRAGFGNLEMAIKDSDGVIIPSHVTQLETGSAKFLVTFTPATKGQYTVNITFNKEVLKNSPFEVQIVESVQPADATLVSAAASAATSPQSPPLSKKELKKEKEEKKREEKERAKREKEEKAATSKGKKGKARSISKTAVTKIPSLSRVQQPSSIHIEVAGSEELSITVTDNKKRELPTEVSELEPGVMQVNFVPVDVGDHEIHVKYGGAPVTGSPFTCRAYDPTMIRVGTIPKGLVDKPVYFTVDASEAGVGNLEVAVNEGRVPSMAHALGQHKYDISFVPKDNSDHTITVRFNNEPVPGSPFTCRMMATPQATATGPGLERIAVDEETQIVLQTNGPTENPPEVRVRDSQANDLPVKISNNKKDPALTVINFTPKCVGNHQIDVSLDGEPIAGSPFTAKAYDARQARLSPCDRSVVGKPTTFTIDAARAGAGNMEIIVSVDNRNVPNFVQSEGQAKFKVSFTPQEPREHVISVKFNGVSVPGSPMTCPVESGVSGSNTPVLMSASHAGSAPPQKREKLGLGKELAGAQVGQKKGFTIENVGGRAKDCNVIIIAPDGSTVANEVEQKDNSFLVSFVPNIKGKHELSVKLDEDSLTSEPITFVVRDAPLSLPPVCIIGKKYSFDIDASDKETLQVDIRDPDGKSQAVLLEGLPDNGGVRASCRFKEIGVHTIACYVNNELIQDIKYQKVVDAVNGVQLISELSKQVVGMPSEHKLLIESGIETEVSIEIEGPDRNILNPTLKKVSDTLWAICWIPASEGPHEMSVTVASNHISGSPFPVAVLDPSAVRIIGLRSDRVGTEIQFNVDYALSGAQSASVDVRHGNKAVECVVKKVKPGLLVCSFVPQIQGLHTVDINIDGLMLPECPYECFVTDAGSVRASGDALKRAQRGRVARFEVSLNDSKRGELDVLVSDPKGGPVPVRCYKQQDDSYWVEFTPEQTGTHTIEVTFGDVAVAGSPFRCEVVDPKRVQVRGVPESIVLRHATTINVNRGEAGVGDLQVDVTDPTGAPLKLDFLKSPGGEDRYTFLPSKTGPHKINLRMSGFQVPGYPQTVQVGEQELPTVYGAAIDQSIKINEPASLIFDPKSMHGGLKIYVTGPQNTKIHHNVMRRPNGTSEIVFYPEEVGVYKANIDFNNKPLKGSPFSVQVVDPSKVIVNDLDMDRDGTLLLRLGHHNMFDVDATAAGPGKLRAEVRDADNVLLREGPEVDDLGYGKYRVSFSPRQPGRYSIFLFWNELPVEGAYPVRARSGNDEMPSTSKHHVAHTQQSMSHVAQDSTGTPSSPVMHKRDKSGSSANVIASADDDISRIMVRGDGLHRGVLQEPNEFIVDGSDLSKEGRLTANLYGQKADVPVRIQQIGHNVFKANYTPMTPGNYELNLLWNGRHLSGSPYKVSVESTTTPADLIIVDASTLKIGIIGEELKTVIDTRRSGPGQLSAQCMGPVKLAYCELYDHRDGTYTLNIRPAEVGKHTLTIKYNDVHVHGSPYIIHVSNPPDPSKVRVYGPGVEHGILSMFKSNFVVETRGAGAGQLTVRVRGPKGAFNVEMQREKKNERTIHCKYEPREPGDYQVEVKWHGEHVPDSPFLVMIVDTEQELSRFLRGEAPSPSPATPFIPPGWVGPPPIFAGGMGGPPGMRGPPYMMGMPPPPPMGPMVPYGVPPPPRHKGKYH
ncbi:unnamed protein product [Auanema sp. JU1783]|nr:unnamed protein product [Auanema sp. JU1783]